MNTAELSLWQLILLGGPLMIPLIFCSIFAMAIIIEKLSYFSRRSVDVNSLKFRVFDLIKNNEIKEAISLCSANPSPSATILKAGILKIGHSNEELRETLQETSFQEIPKLEAKLPALATIANITPLLGLLGTVTGLTQSFFTLQARSASLLPVVPADLLGGIGQALLTTVAGLLISIPSLIFYNYLVNRVHSFIFNMEETATALINFLSQLSETDKYSDLS